MVQILPKVESFGSQFGKAIGGGLGKGLSEGYSEGQENNKKLAEITRKKKAVSDMFGEHVAEMDPDLQKLYIGEKLKGENLKAEYGYKSDIEKEKARSAYEAKESFAKKLGLLPDENKEQDEFEGKSESNEQIDYSKKFPGIGKEQQSEKPKKQQSKKIKDKNTIQDKPPHTKEEIDKAGLINPTLANNWQRQNEEWHRQKEHQEKIKVQEYERSQEYLREKEMVASQAKADTSYYNELQARTKKTVLKGESLDRLESMVKKGSSGKVIDQFLENIGLISKTSEGRRELAAEVKNQYTDFKEVAGSQLSAMEFQILSGAYPNPNFSQEANLAIIKNLKIVRDTSKKEHEIAESLIKGNGGKKPENFQSKVNEKLFEYIESRNAELKSNTRDIMYDKYKVPPGKILMFVNGDEDQPLYANPDKVDHYLKIGAEFP
jgi:hypothetical protein